MQPDGELKSHSLLQSKARSSKKGGAANRVEEDAASQSSPQAQVKANFADSPEISDADSQGSFPDYHHPTSAYIHLKQAWLNRHGDTYDVMLYTSAGNRCLWPLQCLANWLVYGRFGEKSINKPYLRELNNAVLSEYCPYFCGGSEGLQCKHDQKQRAETGLPSPGSKEAVAEPAKALPRGTGNRRKRKLPARSGA